MHSSLPRIVALVFVAAALTGCERQSVISADLAFNFTCHGAFYPASEPAMEKFLADHGFTVFNEERVRRQYKLALYPLAIDGYTPDRRMLDFRGINDKNGDKPDLHATIYSVGIYSPPPTRHDAALEKSLLAFVSSTLKCDVSNISHGDNAADRAVFFDKVYQAEQKRIAAGSVCDKQSGRPLDTTCPS